ncbi:YceI family protein [Streptomyces sp. NPDC046915]|uniref:YceI family protein n=1 Tax=Streptomyces sp. NPDC046915 TaxID=3155257 RepID=UPI0033FA0093
MDATGNTAMTTPRLGRYTIDADNSSISFKSRHVFGLLPVRGSFSVHGGTIEVAEPLSASRVLAEVDAASFRTGHAQRDTAVRSVKFLDTDRYPLITFASDRVDATRTTVSGTLTVCGAFRPARLSIARCEVLADAFTVHATTQVDRTEFGVTAARGMAGRHLDLTLEIRCVRT